MTNHHERLRRLSSTDPADAFEPADPQPLPLAVVEELAGEVDAALEDIFADRVLDQDAEAIRKWLEPKLRRKLMGSAGPPRESEPDEPDAGDGFAAIEYSGEELP